jgi:hypothetical protein
MPTPSVAGLAGTASIITCRPDRTTKAACGHIQPPGGAPTSDEGCTPLLGVCPRCARCCCWIASAHPTVEEAWEGWAGRCNDSCKHQQGTMQGVST